MSNMTPDQEQKLDEIHRAVIGEEKTGHIGLVKRVAALEEWKLSVILKIVAVSGIVTGVAMCVKLIIKGTI